MLFEQRKELDRIRSMSTGRFFQVLVILLFFCFPAVLSAQTRLVFFTEDGSLFYLYLNGQLQNKTAREQVAVDQLTLDDYQVTIEFRDMDEDPIKFSTPVKKDRENIFIIHEGDQRNKVEVYSVSKKGEYSPTTKSAAYDMKGYSGKLGCPWPMGSKEFNRKINDVKNRQIDQVRMSIVKETVLNKCVTMEQFAAFLELFDKDPDKVKLAKFSISYLHDRENYEQLSGAFKNQNNMDKVRQYVEERRIH